MKHMTREETVRRHVLQRARTVAIIGASPNPERHSHTVASYLKSAGYDVIPIRPDGGDVAKGGGGRVAGGGARSILDEKKMVKGAPSLSAVGPIQSDAEVTPRPRS